LVRSRRLRSAGVIAVWPIGGRPIKSHHVTKLPKILIVTI
jgi:hypothetical protein